MEGREEKGGEKGDREGRKKVGASRCLVICGS
jgi:hypothetical protein